MGGQRYCNWRLSLSCRVLGVNCGSLFCMLDGERRVGRGTAGRPLLPVDIPHACLKAAGTGSDCLFSTRG